MHLILADGESAGVVDLSVALARAEEANLDLVAISPRAEPPVVRVIDYNKFRYQRERKARAGEKTKNTQLKEVRLSYLIGAHDLEIKAKQAAHFLSEGHFVRAYIQLRGRQNIFAGKAKEALERFQELAGGVNEQPVVQNGKRLQIIMKPGKASV